MNYLLLMYHPETYWQNQTPERDELEEQAFTTFCGWMREAGITWQSYALTPFSENQTRRFTGTDLTSGMLPEVSDVVSGIFLLTIPDESLASEVLNRCPHIEGTRLELRGIDG